ncbi:hypothetical protein GMLC_43350 [Geomonas limicola]|uniref:Cytochrome c n=1 Tax=Geomonas limicola TaxID=2740186 RepID=A0A6V8NDY5_9BACT|nr:hypothetical protein GMLC_43350 [Geomonas limicola]
MRRSIALTIAVTLLSLSSAWALWETPAKTSGSKLGAVTGGEFKQAHEVISKKCVSCHTEDRISAAFLSGKNMTKIQQEMEKKGAKLEPKEREVLGIFWKQTPLKPAKKPVQ